MPTNVDSITVSLPTILAGELARRDTLAAYEVRKRSFELSYVLLDSPQHLIQRERLLPGLKRKNEYQRGRQSEPQFHYVDCTESAALLDNQKSGFHAIVGDAVPHDASFAYRDDVLELNHLSGV